MHMTQNCWLLRHKGNFPGKSKNNKTTQICLKYSLMCAWASNLERYLKNNRLSPKTMVQKNLESENIWVWKSWVWRHTTAKRTSPCISCCSFSWPLTKTDCEASVSCIWFSSGQAVLFLAEEGTWELGLIVPIANSVLSTLRSRPRPRVVVFVLRFTASVVIICRSTFWWVISYCCWFRSDRVENVNLKLWSISLSSSFSVSDWFWSSS